MKKFFVLGSDIKYSLSPEIFYHLFKIFGDKAQYSILDISESELSNIKKLSEGVEGFNVTKPFKTEIIKYLNRSLSVCGSVNTVTVSDMTGYSTDGDGFLFDLERNFPGASSSPVLVIGYGGAARAIVAALKKCGAEIKVIGRDKLKAEAFAKQTGVDLYKNDFMPQGVISCVTETFWPHLTIKPKFCYDLRYSGDTLKLDCPSSNGLGMLIAQAIYSYSIFCGKEFDKDEINGLYLKLKELL